MHTANVNCDEYVSDFWPWQNSDVSKESPNITEELAYCVTMDGNIEKYMETMARGSVPDCVMIPCYQMLHKNTLLTDSKSTKIKEDIDSNGADAVIIGNQFTLEKSPIGLDFIEGAYAWDSYFKCSFDSIFYTSHMLYDAQANHYTVNEKFMKIVFESLKVSTDFFCTSKTDRMTLKPGSRGNSDSISMGTESAAAVQQSDFRLPSYHVFLIKFFRQCLKFAPAETVNQLRACNLSSLLFGKYFMSGGESELAILEESGFRTQRTVALLPSTIIASIWQYDLRLVSHDQLSKWRYVCAYGWLWLRDRILDFYTELMTFSLQPGGAMKLSSNDSSEEIFHVVKMLTVASSSPPSYSSLTLTCQIVNWLRQILSYEVTMGLDQLSRARVAGPCLINAFELIISHTEVVETARLSVDSVDNSVMNETPVQHSMSYTLFQPSANSCRYDEKIMWITRLNVLDFVIFLSRNEIFASNNEWIDLFLSSSGNDDEATIPIQTRFDSKSAVSIKKSSLLVPQLCFETIIEHSSNLSSQGVKALEVLLLSPDFRMGALHVLMRLLALNIIEISSTINTPSTDNPVYSTMLFLSSKIVMDFLWHIRQCLAPPLQVVNAESALSCMRALTWLLRCNKYFRIRQNIQEIFRSVHATGGLMSAFLSMTNISKAPDFPKQLSSALIRQAIALMGSMMSGNEVMRTQFSKMFTISTLNPQVTTLESFDWSYDVSHHGDPSSPVGTDKIGSLGGSDSAKKYKMKSSTFEHIRSPSTSTSTVRRSPKFSYPYSSFATMVLNCEQYVEVETIIVLFDFILDAQCCANRSYFTDPLVIEQGLFSNDDDRPKIQNNYAIPCLFSVIPYCSTKVQCFVLRTFQNLITGRASLVNVNLCSLLQPSVLIFAVDLFPVISKEGEAALVRIIQILGKHNISVSQLKYLFRMMQRTDEYKPSYSWRILEVCFNSSFS
jgi:hypothetical protein